MALNPDKELKTYYSIKEVAQMFSVSEPTLRYWETEFPQLKPRTTAAKVRQYAKKDIECIRLIHSLVKVRGFRIAAARKMLSANRAGVDRRADVLEMLVSVRDQLTEIKEAFDKLA